MRSTPKPHDLQIGGYIRAHRKARGWTLIELEEKSGINEGALSKIERGEQSLRNRTILALARAFDIALGELFDDPDVKQ